MWISDKEYRNWMFQREIARQEDENNKKLIDDQATKIKGLLDSQVPFSTYYAERLEWWKKQFDKEPEKCHIKYELQTGEIIKQYFDSPRAMREEFEEENQQIAIGDTILFRQFIVKQTPISGHPSPYNDDEITVWAKEQLDEEMQGWKVVKEEKTWTWPIYGKSPLAEMADLFQSVFTRKMAAEYKQRHGILTDISGD